MRSSFIVFAMLICMHTSIAQDNHIPAQVTKAFAKAYPAVTKVKWEKEQEGYEASFGYQDNKMSVVYNDQGQLQETETAIATDKLPARAQQYARNRGHVKEAARIVKADGTVIYEAEVNHEDLLFDGQGNFLNSKKD